MLKDKGNTLVISGLILLGFSIYTGTQLWSVIRGMIYPVLGNVWPLLTGFLLLILGTSLKMKPVEPRKLEPLNKGIFYLGWLGVMNPVFWLSLILKYLAFPNKKQTKFFNSDTFKVVYLFGWINLIGLVLLLL